ncbi:hypothetical protein U8Q05_25780 [Rhizobium ruizarguesonis]|nr:hypothetical protein U8Q05_25780 [Rhizobium ruizarguesonis]
MHLDPKEAAQARISREEIIEAAANAMFGNTLVNNVHRAILVEALVSRALNADWTWVSKDWAWCDFIHQGGTRLEVKQSAARQTWHKDGDPPSKSSFDIAARQGAWEGSKWIPGNGRNAEIYVFGHHPLTGAEADHADPVQWVFHVVPTSLLPPPPRRVISLAALAGLSRSVHVEELGQEVERIRLQLAELHL